MTSLMLTVCLASSPMPLAQTPRPIVIVDLNIPTPVPFVPQPSRARLVVAEPLPILPNPQPLPLGPLPPQPPVQILPPTPSPAILPSPAPTFVPAPLPVRIPTLEQFGSAFRPAPGSHRFVVLHPVTKCPVEVCLTLPDLCLKRYEVNRRSLIIDYGRTEVRVIFRLGGKVDVIYD